MQKHFLNIQVCRLFAVVLTIAALLVPMMNAQASADSSGITINGVTLTDNSIVHNGVTYVPMRSTFEGLGATVTFQGQTATALMNGNNVLSATIGSNSATIRGVSQALDAPVYETNGLVYIPITALATIFGAHITQTATGWNITSAAPHTGVPWWLWALIALAVVAVVLWFMRRPSFTTTPSFGVTQNPLVVTLLGLLPTLGVAHRTGITASILDKFASKGTTAHSFQDAGVDVAAARSGDVGAVGDLVKQAAGSSPQGLRDAIANYSQSVPSFMTNLNPNVASSLKGLLHA
jgi:Copper amine oxidase N-terminal domain